MDFNDIEKVKMPIVYISLSVILGDLCYGIYNDYLWLAVITASLFFVFIKFKNNLLFTIILIPFFIIGILVGVNYYGLKVSDNFNDEISIVESQGYYKIAKYKGRKLYIDNKNFKMDEGKRYLVSGRFFREINKEAGVIGKLDIINSKKLKDGFIYKLQDLRKKVYFKLEKNMGKRKAGLITSLAFGYDQHIDSEDKNDMRNLGIIHAISVSGLHVAIIFAVLNKLVGKFFGLGATTIYVLFTGAPFSAIRALIMIYCLALSFGFRKNYNPLASLSLSALIITIIYPYSIFQIGFLLSFGATLGIILYSNKINRILYKLPKYLRETIAISVSAQVFTLPILILAFKEISLLSFAGNLIVLPIFNILIILGNLTIGFIMIPSLFDFTCYIIMKIIYVADRIIEVINGITAGTILNESIVIIYFSLIISIYFAFKGYKKFMMLPIIAIFIVSVYIYSPIIRIDYLREGGLLISYKGDRKIICNKRNIDIMKLKKSNLASEYFREGEKIYINDNIKIYQVKKDFKMLVGDRQYIIRMNRKSEFSDKYDIINFVDSKNRGFYILNKDIYIYK